MVVRPVEAPAYRDFAPYYDAVYRPLVDYEGDVDFLQEVFRVFGKRPVSRLLDLGCGTGTHALLLADAGVRVDGLDASPELLAVARSKAAAGDGTPVAVRFLQGDMVEDLPPGPYDAVVSMFGAVNYVVEDQRFSDLLAGIAKRLEEGGLLVFELWSPGGVRIHRSWDRTETPAGRSILRVAEQAFDLEDGILTIEMEVVVLQEDAVEARFRETHRLRTRTPAEVKRLLAAHGLELQAFTAADGGGKSLDPPEVDAFRVMVVARKVREP